LFDRIAGLVEQFSFLGDPDDHGSLIVAQQQVDHVLHSQAGLAGAGERRHHESAAARKPGSDLPQDASLIALQGTQRTNRLDLVGLSPLRSFLLSRVGIGKAEGASHAEGIGRSSMPVEVGKSPLGARPI